MLNEDKTIGYITDDVLVSRILDFGRAYISNDGAICTTDIFNDEIDQIAELLKVSTEAFNGDFFGLVPPVRGVSPDTIKDHLRELSAATTSLSTGGRALNLDNTDAALALKSLLEDVMASKASDLHIINVIGSRTEIQFRLDGDLIQSRNKEADYGVEICTYAALNLGEVTDYSITGDIDATFNINLTEVIDVNGSMVKREKETSWRLSQIPVTKGSKVTIRNLGTASGKIPKMGELGLASGHEVGLLQSIEGKGAVLISGPTGSGKTTLINSMLQYIPLTKMIHTLEDPPEWSMQRPNEVQTRVNEQFVDTQGKKSKSFLAYSLKLLRHDTDVIYFGEVREAESAKQFMRMSETGQLCVGTLHTNSAISTISTLVQQMDVSPNQLSSPDVLKALGHQRLIKKLCDEEGCTQSHDEVVSLLESVSNTQLSDEQASLKRFSDYVINLNIDTRNVRYRKINNLNCPKCKGKGEVGRTALFELIVIDEAAREFISNMDLRGWLKHLKAINWPSIQDHGIEKVRLGLVDIRAVMDQVDGIVSVDSAKLYNATFH